jgi:hypothetical protein
MNKSFSSFTSKPNGGWVKNKEYRFKNIEEYFNFDGG